METTINKIDSLKDILIQLSDEKIQEVYDFAAFLAEREAKRKAFIEETLKAEKEPTIRYESVEDAVKAIFDEVEN